MRTSVAAGPGAGPSVVRADRVSSDPDRAPEMRADRTYSAERADEARDYDAAISASGVSNYAIAGGYLGVTESIVRRMRAGSYPLTLAALVLGPAGAFRAVLVRAALRVMGKAGAMAFFAECMAEVAKARGA